MEIRNRFDCQMHRNTHEKTIGTKQVFDREIVNEKVAREMQTKRKRNVLTGHRYLLYILYRNLK